MLRDVFSTRRSPTTTGTDRARYELDRQRVNDLGICTHLADARCPADISRSYNHRIGSIEDVIIIGGGPVGFINALGLAQAGVRVSVIEAEPHIINSPRAAVYSWSVLGGLGRLGVLEEAEAAGVRKQDYTRKSSVSPIPAMPDVTKLLGKLTAPSHGAAAPGPPTSQWRVRSEAMKNHRLAPNANR